MVMVAIVNEGDYISMRKAGNSFRWGHLSIPTSIIVIIDTMGWFGSYHNQLYKIRNLKTQH